jgi:hypothetical protein
VRRPCEVCADESSELRGVHAGSEVIKASARIACAPIEESRIRRGPRQLAPRLIREPGDYILASVCSGEDISKNIRVIPVSPGAGSRIARDTSVDGNKLVGSIIVLTKLCPIYECLGQEAPTDVIMINHIAGAAAAKKAKAWRGASRRKLKNVICRSRNYEIDVGFREVFRDTTTARIILVVDAVRAPLKLAGKIPRELA